MDSGNLETRSLLGSGPDTSRSQHADDSGRDPLSLVTENKHCCRVVVSPSSFQYRHVWLKLVFILFFGRRKNNGEGDKIPYFKRDLVLHLWPTSHDRLLLQGTGEQPRSQRAHLL